MTKKLNYVVTCGITGRSYKTWSESPGQAREHAANTMETQPSPISRATFVSSALVDIQGPPLPPDPQFDTKPEDHEL